jgi:hypothetical protein
MTRLQYMQNELDNAELKAQTLDDPEDRAKFEIHAHRLVARINAMSECEGAKVMFEEDVSK